MSYSVVPLQGTTGFPSRDSTSGELLPYRYLVSNFPVGADPRIDPLIPIEGSFVTVGGFKYRCDRVSVAEVISDTSCVVEARFSSDGRFRFYRTQPDSTQLDYREWDLGFEKVDLVLPMYTRGVHETTDLDGTESTERWWYLSEDTVPHELDVLHVRVNVQVSTDDDVRDIITRARAQKGHLHRFDFPPDTYWVMQTPHITRRGDEGFVTVEYAWSSDPGNGAVGIPVGLTPDEVVTAPRRPSFYAYSKVPVRVPGGTPAILVTDLFPPTEPDGSPNRFYDPNGWRTLPGNPL